MTAQEAIDVLQNSIVRFGRNCGKTVYAKALDMAIEALQRGLENVNADSCSEEPNRSDFIRRQDAIDAIWDGINYDIYTREVKEILEELPSAQPDCEKCIFEPFKQFQSE